MFTGFTLLPNPSDESLIAPWRWHQDVLVQVMHDQAGGEQGDPKTCTAAMKSRTY